MGTKDIYFGKATCVICNAVVSVKQLNNHYESKSCKNRLTHKKPLSNCPYCEIDLKDLDNANHVRWCKMNPKRDEYCKTNLQKSIKAMNDSKKESGRFNQFSAASIDNKPIPDHPNKGKKLLGTPHSEKTKALLKDKALNNPYQRKCRSTHSYTDKNGREFNFDSRWEDILADRLDELNLKWDRPDPLFYIDINGCKRKYYGDFYLPQYDVYLDPKNSYVCKVQHKKLLILSNQINLLVLNLEQCKHFDLDMLALVL